MNKREEHGDEFCVANSSSLGEIRKGMDSPALLVISGHWSLLVSWEKLHPFTPVAIKILILSI